MQDISNLYHRNVVAFIYEYTDWIKEDDSTVYIMFLKKNTTVGIN